MLDALLLIAPADICADEAAGRRIARRATGAVEGRLSRELIVRPHRQAVRHGDPGLGWSVTSPPTPIPWARQWPVVLITSDRPTPSAPLTAPPVEIGGATYAHHGPGLASGDAYDPGLGDETGERLGLPGWPVDSLALFLAGYRRPDQTGETGREGVNAALAEAFPAWGAEALSVDVWGRVPILPSVVQTAAAELARGFLAQEAAGVGALGRRTQDRGTTKATVVTDPAWEARVLAPLDRLAHLDL